MKEIRPAVLRKLWELSRSEYGVWIWLYDAASRKPVPKLHYSIRGLRPVTDRIKIRLHVPGFVDVGSDFRFEYEAASWQDLAKTERLAGWANDPEFDHWCISDDHLMAEMKPRNGERVFWVVAYILEGRHLLDFPAWESPPPEPEPPRHHGQLDKRDPAYRQFAAAMRGMAPGVDAYLRKDPSPS